jgi:hypothetical protein
MYRREYDLFIKHCNLVLCIAEAHTATLKQAERAEKSERGREGKPHIKILASAHAKESASNAVDMAMSIDEEKAQRLYGELRRLPTGYFTV